MNHDVEAAGLGVLLQRRHRLVVVKTKVGVDRKDWGARRGLVRECERLRSRPGGPNGVVDLGVDLQAGHDGSAPVRLVCVESGADAVSLDRLGIPASLSVRHDLPPCIGHEIDCHLALATRDGDVDLHENQTLSVNVVRLFPLCLPCFRESSLKNTRTCWGTAAIATRGSATRNRAILSSEKVGRHLIKLAKFKIPAEAFAFESDPGWVHRCLKLLTKTVVTCWC
jgi:hypothetical protein